jgi:hypothetical protein
MALMDIDDLDGALTTAATTVRPSGWFALSIIHAAFSGETSVRAALVGHRRDPDRPFFLVTPLAPPVGSGGIPGYVVRLT